MAGFFVLTGGIAAFGLIMLIIDRLGQRQDRQRAQKARDEHAGLRAKS